MSKRLYKFNCPTCGEVELLAHERVTVRICNEDGCKSTATKSTKPNYVRGQVMGGCDNDKVKG